MNGTGFIGYVKLSDRRVTVLMTNQHVFNDEQMAKDSFVEFKSAGGSRIDMPLVELMVKNSFRHSHEDKVMYAYIHMCDDRVYLCAENEATVF